MLISRCDRYPGVDLKVLLTTFAEKIGGGNETTIMDILKALLIHGMIIRGDSSGDHYGPVSINAPDHRAEAQCRGYGNRIA